MSGHGCSARRGAAEPGGHLGPTSPHKGPGWLRVMRVPGDCRGGRGGCAEGTGGTLPGSGADGQGQKMLGVRTLRVRTLGVRTLGVRTLGAPAVTRVSRVSAGIPKRSGWTCAARGLL